jgi:hypothetical protein
MRITLSAILVAATGLFWAGSVLAVLRIGPIPENLEYEIASTSDPKARCKSSSLTQDKFLEMVRAIVNHGDLTDKTFVEHTLGITLTPKSTAYSHIRGGGFYKGKLPSDMVDAPIRVLLGIGIESLNDASPPDVSSGVAFSELNVVGAAFHNCQYLTRKQLDPKSEGTPLHSNGIEESLHKPNLSTAGTAQNITSIWRLGRTANRRYELEVRYTVRADGSDAITALEISQHSRTNVPSKGENDDEHQH